MRLDKYLTTLGIGSRTQVKELIKKGKITVNGEKILKPDIHIDENNDEVDLNGVNLKYNKFYYYMLNKPAGVLSAVSDNNCKTVIDLLDVTPKKGLFPVGRLDKDTEGLLLITNDGELSHNLLSPTKHVDKTYYVELNGDLIDSDIELFEKGLDIGEKNLTKPAILKILEKRSTALITITEGKYHQVKRMFQAIGLTVTFLKRLTMGPLKLDENLKPGEYRNLTVSEVEALLNNKYEITKIIKTYFNKIF
ncbi:MAG: pseudouridine synthase [Eubacterium ventriosum]